MTKRRWSIALGVLLLLLGAVFAKQAVLWWGSRAPEDEAARIATIANIRPGDVVAEIGAGRGEMARAMAPRLLPGGRLIVTELSDARLQELRAMINEERLAHVEVRRGETAGTALDAECCALIYMRHVFHHFGDPQAMSRALHEALAPGGRLAIIEFPPDWLLGLIAPVPRAGDVDAGHGITAEALMRHLTAAGFSVERHEAAWTAGSFMVLARKNATGR